jgi:hypothetical protein
MPARPQRTVPVQRNAQSDSTQRRGCRAGRASYQQVAAKDRALRVAAGRRACRAALAGCGDQLRPRARVHVKYEEVIVEPAPPPRAVRQA